MVPTHVQTSGNAGTSAAEPNSLSTPTHPILLDSKRYSDRFTAAQSGMHKALLVLMALFAFWLAIENTYSRYVEVFELSVTDRLLRLNLERKSSRKEDPAIRNRTLQDTIANVDNIKQSRTELAKKIENLKNELVDLSIAGTKLPSKPAVAPVLWLASFCCWLAYFSSRRASAHRNLAAYFGALKQEDRAFGVAGEGSMWLVPLPKRIQLTTLPERTSISHSDLLAALGWTERTERKYRLVFVLVTLVLLFVVARVAYISLDMTSDFAISSNFAKGSWRFPKIILTAFLFLICVFSLGTLVDRPSSHNDHEDGPLISRRAFFGGTVSLGLATVLWFRRDMLTDLGNATGLGRIDPGKLTTASLKRPRFIAREDKSKRLSNYRVVMNVEYRNSLVYSGRKNLPRRRPRKSLTLHYANATGEVRLYSTAKTLHHITSVNSDAAISWASKRKSQSLSVGELPLDNSRMMAWEAAAIAMLETNQIDAACQLLMASARLALQQSPRPNMRLVDLLAGIAVRYKKEQVYLTELVKLTKEKVTGEASKKDAGMVYKARLEQWENAQSKWHKRWSDQSKPVWWHHPLETRESASNQTATSDRPLNHLAKRQRPIRLA
jgi:hypothetical protein